MFLFLLEGGGDKIVIMLFICCVSEIADGFIGNSYDYYLLVEYR